MINNLLTRLYKKNSILFTIIFIISYCLLMSIGDNLSLSIGIEKIITLPIGIILSFILLNFLKKNKLLTEYGLKKSSTPPSIMLYYIPLLILISANLWNGITLNFEIHETIFYILSMICVGFLEEIIFRGLLFKEMSKDNIKVAIVISSLTFGIGHIINLINGSNTELIPNLLQVVYATGAGFMFTMIYLKTDSLLICIITHSLFNSLNAFSVDVNKINSKIITSILITLISIFYALYIFVILKKKKQK